MLKHRLKKLEKQNRQQRIACFVVNNERASGAAFWRDDLEWKDLTRAELESLKTQLEADGAKVICVDIVTV